MAETDGGNGWSAAVEARRLWQVFEPIHAVTYFSDECAERYRSIGLKGFWMGYFASRSAPFGAAPPELVTAAFFNFRPSMVGRALPDAWALASPATVLDARLAGSVATLRSVLGDAAHGSAVTEAADLAERAVADCPVGGRPLFGALLALAPPTDPLGRLWHAATLLREHRGDGHVVATVAGGLDGLDAHVTLAATGAVPRTSLQAARGWTDEEWGEAETALGARGWLADGALTEVGRTRRRQIEDLTDELAAAPWATLGRDATTRLHEVLAPMAEAIVGGGAVPYPNPIGVPAPR